MASARIGPMLGGMARILITDDEEGMRAMMAATLALHGHSVIEAKTAREALQKHEQMPADLVITDLVMREMDGTELLRRLHAFSPETPVIAVSGNKYSTIYLNMAKLLGANRVLAKPFSPDALVRAVDGALNARSAHGGASAPPAVPPTGNS